MAAQQRLAIGHDEVAMGLVRRVSETYRPARVDSSPDM